MGWDDKRVEDQIKVLRLESGVKGKGSKREPLRLWHGEEKCNGWPR